MIQPALNPQRLSDRAIALDCLYSSKALAARDVISIVESAHSEVRQLFERMSADHLRMQWEVFEYAKRNGWYPVAHATEQAFEELPRFQPATTHVGYGGYGGPHDQAGQYTAATRPGTGESFAYGVPQGAATFGAHYGQQSQHGYYGQYAQAGDFGQQTTQYGLSQQGPTHDRQLGYQAPYGSIQGDHGFEAADELGEFSHQHQKGRQPKDESRRGGKGGTTQISRRLE